MTTPATFSISRDFDYIFKLVLVGDSGVGKSCLLSRFADDLWTDSFIPTIGVDFRIRTVEADNGKRVKLQMWDTAGQERFHAITTAYYRNGDGIVIAYDTTDIRSFLRVKDWLTETSTYCRSDVVKILIGTKADLESDRKVPLEQAESLCESLGIQHFSTSARTGMNVDVAFNACINLIIDQHEDPTFRLRLEQRKKAKQGKFILQAGEWTPVRGGNADRTCCTFM